jgi:hypothetical protein
MYVEMKTEEIGQIEKLMNEHAKAEKEFDLSIRKCGKVYTAELSDAVEPAI